MEQITAQQTTPLYSGSISREAIKYFAMLTMLLNHIANVFLTPNTLLSDIFLNVGYFTAVTMCYFLVEGYRYTHSNKKYALRLALFAVVSQVPFALAFHSPDDFEAMGLPASAMFFIGFNMMFTLLLCFLILMAQEYIKNKFLRYLTIFLLTFISLFSDWALMAPIFTLLFSWSYGSMKKTRIAYIINACMYGLIEIISGTDRLIDITGGMIAILVSGIAVTFLYSGKRSEKCGAFSKWFFYLFYPVHLAVLCIIRAVIVK